MDRKNLIIGIIIAVFLLLWSMAYTVNERELAIKFKFREIVQDNQAPGLHFKLPFIETVSKFPKPIQNLDANSERFLTGEKKYVLVDFFVKWQIQDVAAYYRATSGIKLNAERRLEDIMKDGLRNEFSRRTIEEALSEQRGDIMQGLEDKSNEIANQLGINIVDVRVSKIDFPEQVSESVFARMRSERERVAQEFRSRGKEESEKIRAAADREATVIMAEAYRESETIRGAGDARAAEVYASAYQHDVEFYSFYRSLSAYRNTLGKPGDMMVLEPDSEFFRYFGNMNNTTMAGTAQPALATVPLPAAAPVPSADTAPATTAKPAPAVAKPPASAAVTGNSDTAPVRNPAVPATAPRTVTPAAAAKPAQEPAAPVTTTQVAKPTPLADTASTPAQPLPATAPVLPASTKPAAVPVPVAIPAAAPVTVTTGSTNTTPALATQLPPPVVSQSAEPNSQ